MPKKFVVSLFFLLLGLISIHFLKNETREMEIKIEKLSKNIFYLKQDLEVEKLEFYYLGLEQTNYSAVITHIKCIIFTHHKNLKNLKKYILNGKNLLSPR